MVAVVVSVRSALRIDTLARVDGRSVYLGAPASTQGARFCQHTGFVSDAGDPIIHKFFRGNPVKNLIVLVAMGALCLGCGELQEAKQAAEAMSQLAEAGEQLAENHSEAEKFMAERRAKGDTVAMAADELKTYLPTAIDGYVPKEEPSVSRTDMGGATFSVAEQEWIATNSTDTNNPSRIKVSVTDWGGTEGGYALYAPMMAINISNEDARQRTASVKLDVPYTAGWEEFQKESKDAKFSAVTRYRFMIALEASNQTEDQTPRLKEIASSLAEKFKDK